MDDREPRRSAASSSCAQRALDWVAEVGRVVDAGRRHVPRVSCAGCARSRLRRRRRCTRSAWARCGWCSSSACSPARSRRCRRPTSSRASCRWYIGSVILRSVIIELGPVLTALVVGGRVGASIAAELGTMRVTEQIDALRAMAINPVRYLVVPRVVACDRHAAGARRSSPTRSRVFGGYVVSITAIGVSSHTYVTGAQGVLLHEGPVLGAHQGGVLRRHHRHRWAATTASRPRAAPRAWARATTRAVVSSCVLVLISDYVLANVLFRFIFAS